MISDAELELIRASVSGKPFPDYFKYKAQVVLRKTGECGIIINGMSPPRRVSSPPNSVGEIFVQWPDGSNSWHMRDELEAA